jgi:hypothetical protein
MTEGNSVDERGYIQGPAFWDTWLAAQTRPPIRVVFHFANLDLRKARRDMTRIRGYLYESCDHRRQRTGRRPGCSLSVSIRIAHFRSILRQKKGLFFGLFGVPDFQATENIRAKNDRVCWGPLQIRKDTKYKD